MSIFPASIHSKEIQSKMAALDRSQAIIEFDMDGNVLTANENFLNALEYTLPEIKGKHHSIFVEKSYVGSAEYKDFWNSLRKGEYQAAQYKRISKTGKEVWIEASYNPLLDAHGKPFKVVKYATEITKRVLENADFKGQVEAIGKAQAVIHFNLDGTIIWANKNFLDALGYQLEEIQGRHHRIFVEKQEQSSKAYENFWDNLRRGEFQSDEYKRIGKAGNDVWIMASYNPIFDPTGKVFKVVKFASDITVQRNKRVEGERIGNAVDQNLSKIVGGIDESMQQSNIAASASTEASATIQTVASGAEELSGSIREIAESMARSRSEVDHAMQQTDMADNATMQLAKAAGAMGSIVVLIQDIASQINMLALNATIEAARAGDAGKGFAVVASEVKNLATQVAQATDKISQEIGNMQNISQDVVHSLSTIKSSMSTIQSGVAAVAGAIEEQSAVTVEISSNMQTASVACDELDRSLRSIVTSITSSNEFALEGQEMYKNLRAL